MQKLLYEVSIIRPFIIILLIFMHSFTAYDGNWPAFECYEPNSIYKWVPKFIMGFMLEAFVFISGYVYSYQTNTLKRSIGFISFAKKKFSRLYIQCVFFGVIYYFLFLNTGTFSIYDLIYKVTDGCGHLWFLPMLFWCFIFIWIVDRYKPNMYMMLAILAFISVIPMPMRLPLGMTKVSHYMLYIYLGYLLYTYKDVVIEKLSNKGSILFLIATYIFQ